MGRPPNCNCLCEEPPVDCAPFDCPDVQHSNADGDASLYTLSDKTWGSGLTLNSYSLATEAGDGFPAPCLKLSVNWSQSKQPHWFFPSVVPPGGAGYEDLFGAWVIVELSDGPQVSLTAGQWLQNISLQCNTRRVSVSPDPDGFAGRYLITAWRPAFWSHAGAAFGPFGSWGGTWEITVDGQTTSSLFCTADAATVQTALEALSSVGSGGVTVGGGLIGQNWFTLHFTDGLEHTITVSPSALLPESGFPFVRKPYHFNYSIVPVVIQSGVVYGPGPALASNVAGGGLVTTDGDELAWKCRSVFAQCPGDAGSGNLDVGSNNYPVHSRYREFLENTKQFPGGFDNYVCQRYCRDEDNFGDWSNATLERWNPTITINAEFPLWDTWVPATPDFSAGDYTLGFAIAFLADEPGDYSADLLIDNLCLDWNVREPLPECSGATLIVDEPMDTSLPSDWTLSIMNHDPFTGNCDDVGLDQYFAANWRIEDGWMITDDVYREDGTIGIPIDTYTGVSPYFWRDRIYTGGSMFKENIGSVADWKNENFCLMVECDLQRLHEEDAEWTAADAAGSPNLNLHRPEEDFGIFIGGIAKFGVIRNMSRPGLSTDNHACDRSFYTLAISGFVDTNGDVITQCQGVGYGAYECDDIDGMGTHFQTWRHFAFDTRGGNEFVNQAVPLKNDKLRLLVRWAGEAATIQDCRAELRFTVLAFINDQETFRMTFRHPTQSPSTVDVSSFNDTGGGPSRDPAWIHSPSVGVYAHRGGKFRNFKAWLRGS